MRVRAIREGYGGMPVKYRIVGEVFDVPDGMTAKWYVEVKDGEAEASSFASGSTSGERDARRAEYERIAGKPPGRKWGIQALKAKLAQLAGPVKP